MLTEKQKLNRHVLIDALRFGEFTQIQGWLGDLGKTNPQEFCFSGLCRYIAYSVIAYSVADNIDYLVYDPYDVYGINTSKCLTNYGATPVGLNDGGWTFNEFADALEREDF